MKRISPAEYEQLFFDRADAPVCVTERSDFALPVRPARSHKYSCGRALILAGAEGYSGAPALAANACERSGAGLTQVAVPRSIYPIVAMKCDGAVVTPLQADDRGGFALEAVDAVLPLLEKADACLIGPGLGQGKGAQALVTHVLRHASCPLVVDADALTILGRHLWLLEQCKAPLILTPHEGEFRRIGGALEDGRVAGAKAFAAAHPDAVLALKGFGTIVCRGGELHVNHTGSAAMAKGGTGDVLSGMICALLAQGMEPLRAAQTAVYLHGLAGDLAAEITGAYSLAPSDLIRFLPSAFRTLPQAGIDPFSD